MAVGSLPPDPPNWAERVSTEHYHPGGNSTAGARRPEAAPTPEPPAGPPPTVVVERIVERAGNAGVNWGKWAAIGILIGALANSSVRAFLSNLLDDKMWTRSTNEAGATATPPQVTPMPSPPQPGSAPLTREDLKDLEAKIQKLATRSQQKATQEQVEDVRENVGRIREFFDGTIGDGQVISIPASWSAQDVEAHIARWATGCGIPADSIYLVADFYVVPVAKNRCTAGTFADLVASRR